MFRKKQSAASLDGALSARIAMIAATPAEPGSPRHVVRRSTRVPTSRAAFVSLGGALRIQVMITDLDPLGARIEFPKETKLPQTIVLSAPGLPTRTARVAWQKAGAAGLQFEPPGRK